MVVEARGSVCGVGSHLQHSMELECFQPPFYEPVAGDGELHAWRRLPLRSLIAMQGSKSDGAPCQISASGYQFIG